MTTIYAKFEDDGKGGRKIITSDKPFDKDVDEETGEPLPWYEVCRKYGWTLD